jgi:hypothetical protein
VTAGGASATVGVFIVIAAISFMVMSYIAYRKRKVIVE